MFGLNIHSSELDHFFPGILSSSLRSWHALSSDSDPSEVAVRLKGEEGGGGEGEEEGRGGEERMFGLDSLESELRQKRRGTALSH